MGWLSKTLPAPVYRSFKKFVNPPKPPQDKSKEYSDLYVRLEIPRGVLESSLEQLQDLVRSFHEEVPEIIRVRFNNKDSARGLMVHGMTFQEWLELMEETGSWDCRLYQHNLTLVAGFDRGRSGRTVLDPQQLTEPNQSTRSRRPRPTRIPSKAKKPTTIAKREEETSRVPGLKPSAGHEDIQMDNLPEGRGEHQGLVEYDGTEVEQMSEVRRGKQKVPINTEDDE
ncbi:MAG: hypothetical protein Q9219_003270 [cf. Caloplaca sp. 3 TL-2023]